MKSCLLILAVSMTLMLAACTAPTESPIVPVATTAAPSATPEPTLAATPASGTTPPVTLTPREGTVGPMGAGVPAVTPSVLFPMTWSVKSATTSDGRTIYRVDDPAVIRAAQKGYEKLRAYFTFQNGLPSKEQVEKDMAAILADPDALRGTVGSLEKMREAGGYWVFPPISAYTWADKAEFNEDGSQVSLTLNLGTVRVSYFDIKKDKVTFIQDVKSGSEEVTMLYDEFEGDWKVLKEKGVVEPAGAVASVTPSP